MTSFNPLICALLGLMVAKGLHAQQGLNNLWCGGYESWAGEPNGGIDINYTTGSVQFSTMFRDIGYYRATANISSSDGTLLFSTNGSFLADTWGDTLANGTGINPCGYTSDYPNGHFITQACLILPQPAMPGIYYFLHGSLDNEMNTTSQYLYLSIVDMSLNGGLGAVTIKNQVLIDDVLNAGRITAVRHANGRDWWVFCHKAYTNQYYRLLATPNGVSMDGTQNIGINRPPDLGQVCFSPNGNKFAYYWGVSDLEIFDFDRCTGLFSNPVFIPIDDDNVNSGVAFSPNNRYLYVSSASDAYQFDTQAADIAGSMIHIAHWDGFYSPSPPFATGFDLAQLAPDGKVYMSTGNSTFHLHVVNNPDEAGLACNMVQHGVELPRWFSNSLPNHPNYHLGPVDGSVCDSLGINTGVSEALLDVSVTAYPNPCNGDFSVSYPAQATLGVVEVHNVAGEVVLQEKLPQWSTLHQVQLHASPGMYHCRLRWGTQSTTVRVIVIEP